MKTLALLLASLLVAGCSGCASVDYAAVKPATVRLEFRSFAGTGICSGTAVGAHTILTATHCFDSPAGTMHVDGIESGYVIVADDGQDHVFVRVTARQDHVAKRGLKPKQGDTVYMHGNPSGYADLLRVGYVAGWVENAMMVDANNFKGDSGSAVFDRHGRIVGVVSQIFPWPNPGWRLTQVNPFKFTQEQWKDAET